MKSWLTVTGANGFVGVMLTKRLHTDGKVAHCIVRSKVSTRPCAVDSWLTAIEQDINAETNWAPHLTNTRTIIHCAARTHVMHERATDPLAAYRAINVEGTRRLAEQAAEAGVQRFVFLSSIKVNGESTQSARPFQRIDPPAPEDPYGISKWEAEQALWEIGTRTGLEIVIIRPPLVYGPRVKANFRTMLGWVVRGIPLPLGAINNLRSLVFIENLVDLIITCIDHPAAANQTFLVSDGEDLSTTDLLRRIAASMHKPSRLLPVPPTMLRAAAAVVGKGEVAKRLCGNLQVDISDTMQTLNWKPPVTVDEGLKKTAGWFLNQP